LGEILVEDELNTLGYSISPTNNNARQKDIVVTTPKGKHFRVEVKTSRIKRACWPVRVCPDVQASDIWCLVCAPRVPTDLPDKDEVEIFVLTSAEALEIWLRSDWNKQHPTNGDIRRWQVPDSALRAWHKLPDYSTRE
jgi:hypothetical protein